MKKFQLTYGYDDVTLVPNYSNLKSRSEASPRIHNYKIPIIGSCMDSFGRDMMISLITHDIPFIVHRSFKSPDEQFNHFFKNTDFAGHAEFDSELNLYYSFKNIWFAVGSLQKYKDWIDKLYFYYGVRQFCVDMAHGDSECCIETVKYLRKLLDTNNGAPESFLHYVIPTCTQKPHIIAGNVATAEGFKRLQNAGANGIRIGIASGQCCSTALQTGFGVPILTNIIECNKVRKKGVWIIADGGVRTSGDVAKAVYFGADFCMIGKLLAATDKACGKCYNINKNEIILNSNIDNNSELGQFNKVIYPDEFQELYENAIKLDKEHHDNSKTRENMVKNNSIVYKGYHGMASREARKGILSYASPEGAQGMIKYTRRTKDFINDMELNLQASLSYAGARNWTEFRKNTYPVMRSNAGIIAADTHLDITLDR